MTDYIIPIVLLHMAAIPENARTAITPMTAKMINSTLPACRFARQY
jgi:hypothetical protein